MKTKIFLLILCICISNGCIRDQVKEATLPISPFAGVWSPGRGAGPEGPEGKKIVREGDKSFVIWSIIVPNLGSLPARYLITARMHNFYPVDNDKCDFVESHKVVVDPQRRHLFEFKTPMRFAKRTVETSDYVKVDVKAEPMDENDNVVGSVTFTDVGEKQ